MRRRRAPLFPLLVPPLIVLIAVTIAFYNPRYRAAAETSLVVLAAVAIDAAIARLASGARPRPSVTRVCGCSSWGRCYR